MILVPHSPAHTSKHSTVGKPKTEIRKRRDVEMSPILADKKSGLYLGKIYPHLLLSTYWGI